MRILSEFHKFQFHIGSIKSKTDKQTDNTSNISFNSTLVQLKAHRKRIRRIR